MSGKKVDRAEFVARLLAARERGETVIFTNGCFDLVHVGHLRYLQAARALGDLLAVAVNTDDSVSRLKGAVRPIVPCEERQELLAGFACVDLVTSFHEDTPTELIRACRPHVLVKGADAGKKPIPGADLVRADGGRVELIHYVEGRSSTELIRRAARAAAAEGLA